MHLRQILDAPGVEANVMPGYEFLLGSAHKAFDESGNLNNEGTIDFLETCFLRFLRFAKISNQLNEEEEFTYNPGVYEVNAIGHSGNLPMKVSFSENRIESIDIDSTGETEGIVDVVFVRIPNKIIEGQTLNVDALSGASETSNAVINGVSKAVKLAGVNPDILKRRPKPASSQMKNDEEYICDVVVVGGGGARTKWLLQLYSMEQVRLCLRNILLLGEIRSAQVVLSMLQILYGNKSSLRIQGKDRRLRIY
ncbi:FMN-binding protein [Paenibacillus amylolyticus]|nr:FMN-binding protein [Paenibacillus amylolyticus]